MEEPTKIESEKYAEYAAHPRYGRGPRITGLNPSPFDAAVKLNWNTAEPHEIAALYKTATGMNWPYGNSSLWNLLGRRIPNTAILADLALQTRATIPVTHYFDLNRQCRDCARFFIFLPWSKSIGTRSSVLDSIRIAFAVLTVGNTNERLRKQKRHTIICFTYPIRPRNNVWRWPKCAFRSPNQAFLQRSKRNEFECS